jgi:hypothetical protein
MLALGAVGLAACASDPRPADPGWTGGDPAHLAADSAQCRKEAADLDVNAPDTYSDPRYGVTSAMAAAVARNNPLTDTGPQIRQAAFTTCMNDKGWRQP